MLLRISHRSPCRIQLTHKFALRQVGAFSNSLEVGGGLPFANHSIVAHHSTEHRRMTIAQSSFPSQRINSLSLSALFYISIRFRSLFYISWIINAHIFFERVRHTHSLSLHIRHGTSYTKDEHRGKEHTIFQYYLVFVFVSCTQHILAYTFILISSSVCSRTCVNRMGIYVVLNERIEHRLEATSIASRTHEHSSSSSSTQFLNFPEIITVRAGKKCH